MPYGYKLAEFLAGRKASVCVAVILAVNNQSSLVGYVVFVWALRMSALPKNCTRVINGIFCSAPMIRLFKRQVSEAMR